MRTVLLSLWLPLLSAEPAGPAAEPDSPILKTLRTCFAGFDFNVEWSGLGDPMKSRLRPAREPGPPPPPAPLAEPRVEPVRTPAEERGDAARRLRGALDRMAEARRVFDAGRHGECRATISEARGLLPGGVVRLLGADPLDRDAVNRLLREMDDLDRRAAIRESFPRDVFQVRGTFTTEAEAAVMIGGETYRVGEDLGGLDPRLEGASISGVRPGIVEVRFRGEAILVPAGER